MGVQVIINNNNKKNITIYYGSRVYFVCRHCVSNVSIYIGRYQGAKAQWFWCKCKLYIILYIQIYKVYKI